MKIGIIGGTGLYELPGLEQGRNIHRTTPFGLPSAEVFHGRLAGHDIFFLPRHGVGHRLLPSEINHQANIFCLKELGVDRVIGISAVGSLQETYSPGDLLFPDQYFDRTKTSERHTFFGQGIVAHIGFGDPVCEALRGSLAAAAARVVAQGEAFRRVRLHNRGTYVNMEGPAFSTRAESQFYRQCGFDVIGMTSLAEAKLCREAELCYASLALITDYDCWHEAEEDVSADMVMKTIAANVRLTHAVLAEWLTHPPDLNGCACQTALGNALITRPENLPAARRDALRPLLKRHLAD